MPYSDISQLPRNIRAYSEVVQRQWLHVWDSTYKKTDSEVRAIKAANSILKKRFTGNKSLEKNTRNDYFNHLVDNYLGRLPG